MKNFIKNILPIGISIAVAAFLWVGVVQGSQIINNNPFGQFTTLTVTGTTTIGYSTSSPQPGIRLGPIYIPPTILTSSPAPVEILGLLQGDATTTLMGPVNVEGPSVFTSTTIFNSPVMFNTTTIFVTTVSATSAVWINASSTGNTNLNTLQVTGASIFTAPATFTSLSATTGTFTNLLATGLNGFMYANNGLIGTTPTSTILNLFSSSATGLTYTAASGIFSLTSGYNIPLTASTTNWDNFYQTPSSRITAGTNMSWSGNTLNGPTNASVLGLLSAGTGISYNNGTGVISNIGVTSILGTANQVIASSPTGTVTLSLPQSIATTSSVTFSGLTATNVTSTNANITTLNVSGISTLGGSVTTSVNIVNNGFTKLGELSPGGIKVAFATGTTSGSLSGETFIDSDTTIDPAKIIGFQCGVRWTTAPNGWMLPQNISSGYAYMCYNNGNRFFFDLGTAAANILSKPDQVMIFYTN